MARSAGEPGVVSHPFLRRPVGANCATANHQRNETLSGLLSPTAAPNQGRDQRETLGWLGRGLVSKGPESRANQGQALVWAVHLVGWGLRAKPGASPLVSWRGLAGSNSKPMRARPGDQNRFRTRIIRHVHRLWCGCDSRALSVGTKTLVGREREKELTRQTPDGPSKCKPIITSRTWLRSLDEPERLPGRFLGALQSILSWIQDWCALRRKNRPNFQLGPTHKQALSCKAWGPARMGVEERSLLPALFSLHEQDTPKILQPSRLVNRISGAAR